MTKTPFYDDIKNMIETSILRGLEEVFESKWRARAFKIPCHINSDRRNPITPKLKF